MTRRILHISLLVLVVLAQFKVLTAESAEVRRDHSLLCEPPRPLRFLNTEAPRHEFHVAITEIVYNTQTHSLEITIKLFTDDLEKSIKSLGGGELKLGGPQESPKADEILKDYLQNRLQIQVNGQPSTMEWVGKEVELDALWCYLEIKQIPTFSSLQITNRILTELFEDQANVVHVQGLGENKSLFLSKEVLSGTVLF